MSKGKVLVQFMIVFLVLFLFIGSTVATSSMQTETSLYAIYINNTQVGVTKYAARGLSVYDTVVEKINSRYEQTVFLEGDIIFRITDQKNETPEEELAKAMEDAIKIKAMGQGLVINDQTVCYLKSKEDVETLIKSIQLPYQQDIEASKHTVQDIHFKETWSIKEEPVDFASFMSVEQALDIIQSSTVGVEQYTVENGDTIWFIAEENEISVDTLQELNPDLDIEAIQPGETIYLTNESPSLLTVVSTENATYTEDIDFSKKTIKNDSMYVGESKVTQAGQKGKKESQVLITRENGKEINQTIVSETVLTEAVEQIVEEGTKTKPIVQTNTIATGTASEVIAFAKQQLGKPYSSSNNHGPNSFDCSGFTSYVYRQFGINISPSSKAQGSVGTAVNKADLAPGDLLLFTSPHSGGAIGHVGIYLGNNSFIHATSGSRYCVAISTLSGSYNSRYKGARRLLN